MKRAALLLVALSLAAACEAAPPAIELVQPSPPPAAVNKKSPSSPKATVTIAGGPRTRPAMRAAVAEIKRLGWWRQWTAHLTRLYIGARPGKSAVPQDRHLADSLYRPTRRRPEGRFCRVTFYPRAMRDDLAKQRYYYSVDRLPVEPPTMDEFWVAILAHELTHCRDSGRSERDALRVERRVLKRLRAR